MIKISSRAGRFKKKLVSADELKHEAPRIQPLLDRILSLHTQGKISDAELAALYVITYLSIRFPKNWLGAKRPKLGIRNSLNLKVKDIPLPFEENILKRLPENLGDVFDGFALKSTPETVNRALLHWSTNTYPLILMFHIPKPGEVLEQQKQGKRCVTLVTQNLDSFVLGERDPLSFTMHDLIHADHFYHDNICYEGQISLYWFLDHCLKENHFQELMHMPEFKFELEYLISDMNAYAIHSLKCLRAALIFYHPKKDEFYKEWVNKIGSGEDTFLRLNSTDYIPERDDETLLTAMKSFRR